MTAAAHEFSFFKGLGLCLLALLSALGPAMSCLAADASDTMVLQPGTHRGTIRLGGGGTSTLLVGSGGAGANLPTATVTGGIISRGVTIIQTNGANLSVNGNVYPTDSQTQGYNGEMRAWNGNISMNSASGQNQVGILRVAGGMQVSSRSLLVLHDLDLRGGATVSSDTDIHINGALGRPGAHVMQAGSLLTAGGSIYFLDPQGTATGGIMNASGTIHAGGNIGTYFASSYPAFDMLQGSGHLTLEAGGSIGGRNITADHVSAGGTIVAGVDRSSAAQIGVGDAFSITPARTLSGTTIKAGLIAAGEVTDIAGVSTPSRIEAGRLMAVAGAEGSTGDFTIHNGSFSITGTGPVGDAEYGAGGAIVSHDEAAWVGGRLDVNNNGQSSFTTLGVKGAARIGGGSLSGGSLGAASVTLHDGVDATVNAVSVSGGDMQIGAAADTAAATDVKIANLTQNGHALTVGAGAGEAYGAVGNFVTAAGAGNVTDGAITVGHNGRLALGTNATGSLKTITARVGMAPSGAVLGVFSPVVLGSSLAVDSGASVGAARALGRAASGPSRAAGGPVSFSGNSLFVIDGAKSGVNYADPAVPTTALPASVPGALSAAAPTQATVASGAKIYIDHVTPGHTYVALGRNITTTYADDTAWSGGNLVSSNPLLELTRLGNGMEGQFSVTEKAPHTKSVAVASGVPRLARAASESMESAVYSRIKLGQEDLYRHSFALWALPLYESIDHFGLDGGTASYGFSGGIGGLAIGGDYTWDNTLRAGLSLNMGGGYVKSTGDMPTTQNSATFWGIGAYGVWKPGALSFDGEVDYTSVYNKIRQDLPGDAGGGEIKADIPAWSLGMSLRAEYEVDTGYVNLRPHLGVRYLHMVSQPFDASLHGRDVLHGNRTHQDVWTMPFGLVLTRPFRLENGWEITPLVNLKAIPALSDTYAKTSVRYAGSHMDQEFDSQVMDSITWGGRAGVELRAGDFAAGLNYIGQFGEHTANQGLFGVFRYEF